MPNPFRTEAALSKFIFTPLSSLRFSEKLEDRNETLSILNELRVVLKKDEPLNSTSLKMLLTLLMSVKSESLKEEFLIAASKIGGIYVPSFYDVEYNDDKTLNSLEKNEYFKVNNEEFMSFTPQTTGFAIKIPKDKMEVETN